VKCRSSEQWVVVSKKNLKGERKSPKASRRSCQGETTKAKREKTLFSLESKRWNKKTKSPKLTGEKKGCQGERRPWRPIKQKEGDTGPWQIKKNYNEKGRKKKAARETYGIGAWRCRKPGSKKSGTQAAFDQTLFNGNMRSVQGSPQKRTNLFPKPSQKNGKRKKIHERKRGPGSIS